MSQVGPHTGSQSGSQTGHQIGSHIGSQIGSEPGSQMAPSGGGPRVYRTPRCLGVQENALLRRSAEPVSDMQVERNSPPSTEGPVGKPNRGYESASTGDLPQSETDWSKSKLTLTRWPLLRPNASLLFGAPTFTGPQARGLAPRAAQGTSLSGDGIA